MCGVPRSIYQWPSTSISLFQQLRQSVRLDAMTTTIKEGASQLVCVLKCSLLNGIHWPKKLASQPRQCSFSRDTYVFSTAWRSFVRPLRAYKLPNSLLNSFELNCTHWHKLFAISSISFTETWTQTRTPNSYTGTDSNTDTRTEVLGLHKPCGNREWHHSFGAHLTFTMYVFVHLCVYTHVYVYVYAYLCIDCGSWYQCFSVWTVSCMRMCFIYIYIRARVGVHMHSCRRILFICTVQSLY